MGCEIILLKLMYLCDLMECFPMQVLRNFDSMISSHCTQELENGGIEVWKYSQVLSVFCLFLPASIILILNVINA